ncbi:YsnF/AvaK domain-containing protein [Teichococcus vastitatis]|uniref:YsnF/AvaK domain-containing protein n=1 Tax=Teichococcus vastitatis TaxID=2307076 RepID=A0ABS9WA31_9PROT|nr:YsnF/AvaK domain-containing protein [Pseudoroseomonas vastitatis]MCI0755843.1 YsnF/AvaK domain-containing protein [Pseudoroseomonas vastitatis]
MLHTITALFVDAASAKAAVDHLIESAGVSRERIGIYARGAAASGGGGGGFLASLRDLFVPDEDRRTYAEGIRRGGTVVSVIVDQDRHDRVMDILEAQGAVDLDAQEAEWRRSGWSSNEGGETGVNTSRPVSSRNKTEMQDAIPLVEEHVSIGKRNIERGRLRLRSYVVKTPVQEQVALREEHVEVQRRQVDRPVDMVDAAFRERTVEATETAQEAVVVKEARVTAEVVVEKAITERSATVQDSVRHTEIEVEDTTGTIASRTPDRT